MMKVQMINPILESAHKVIEQVIQVSPTRGELTIKEVEFVDKYIWIKIGMKGQLMGDIVFGLHENVAIKIISTMMGGMEILHIDEIGKSAISELSNMISGNASAIFYNQGIAIDITPPQLIDRDHATHYRNLRALVVPLNLGDIGTFDIQVIIN